MRIHITRLNGILGAAGFAQHRVAQVAHGLGYVEMGLYKIPEFLDDDNEQNHRLDGIISSLRSGDVVIMQYPTWNGGRYEEAFMKHIKGYKDCKLVVWVQDVEALQMDPERTYLKYQTGVLSRADVLILPSKQMYQVLVEAGLKIPEERIVYQKIWDYPTECLIEEHTFEKKMVFTGDPKRFSFVNSYKLSTPIELYAEKDIEKRFDQNVIHKGYKEGMEFFIETAKSGFGLVWCNDDYFQQYYCMNQPYKLGVFLAQGLPVVIRKGTAQEDFIREQGLGLLVESLEEADEKIQTMTETEYQRLCQNVKKVQRLITKGIYTQQILVDAVICAYEH